MSEYSEVLVGRGPATKVADPRCSRKQLALVADTLSCRLPVLRNVTGIGQFFWTHDLAWAIILNIWPGLGNWTAVRVKVVQRGGNSSVVDGRELIKDKEVIGKHEDKVKAVSEHTIFPLIQPRLIHTYHKYEIWRMKGRMQSLILPILCIVKVELVKGSHFYAILFSPAPGEKAEPWIANGYLDFYQ